MMILHAQTRVRAVAAAVAILAVNICHAQTLFLPSGTSGIGSSNNGNVGIGTAAPAALLHVEIQNTSSNIEQRIGVWGTAKYARTWWYTGSYSYGAGVDTDNRFKIWRNINAPAVSLAMDNAGNLGIGTASPTAKLDVKGLAGGFGLRVQADDGDGLAGTRPRQLVIHGNTNANLKAEIGFDTTAKVMVISAVEEGVSWRNIGFANNGGSVGIGTTTPTAKLHVAGPGGSSVDFIVNGRMRSDNNDGGLWVQSNRFIGGHGASKMGFYNGGAWRLTVDSAGNTGIGTTSPTHLLTVNGTIRAEEVIVEAGIAAAEVRIRPQAWADDVFAPGYALPTVDDVAAYIEAAGHLPGVPSAATVADQGVALGEMQKTLLRKVEELTLYVIELKRENAELRSRVDNLAQRN